MIDDPPDRNRATAVSPSPARDSVYDPIMTARAVNVHYGEKHAVKNVSLDIGRNLAPGAEEACESLGEIGTAGVDANGHIGFPAGGSLMPNRSLSSRLKG